MCIRDSIYTDASKTNDRCSIAFHSPHHLEIQGQFNISNMTPVYSYKAELTAIFLSLKCVHKLGSHLNYNISIISDSKTVIQDISNPLFKRNTTSTLIIIFSRNLFQYLVHFQNCEINYIWSCGNPWKRASGLSCPHNTPIPTKLVPFYCHEGSHQF